MLSMKGEINNNMIIVGDLNTPLTPMDRSTKEKISKETQTLNDAMDQLDLIDIYRTFHLQTMNFTFFSSAHRTFSRIVHTLGHKSSLGKLKKNWNNFKHLFWSQCGKIRCQLQEKNLLKIKTYAVGWPWGVGWGGRWEGGSGWGTHVHPWLIHANVWQNHYNIVEYGRIL